jgi:hypothetical protein
MKEIIVYRNFHSKRVVQCNSDDQGNFSTARTFVDSRGEEPSIMIGSVAMDLKNVKVMDPENKKKVLALESQINALHQQWSQLLESMFDELPNITWEYMIAHQTYDHVPEPFKHKKAIKKLRKGSKVLVDGSQDAVRWRIANMKGKLLAKKSKNALVELQSGKQMWIPYYVLLPYKRDVARQEREKAKESKKMVTLTDQLNREMGKILR